MLLKRLGFFLACSEKKQLASNENFVEEARFSWPVAKKKLVSNENFVEEARFSWPVAKKKFGEQQEFC